MQKKPESNNQKVRRVIKKVVRKGQTVQLYKLKKQLEGELRVRLREDYMVCNLLGMKGFMVDCEDRVLMRIG